MKLNYISLIFILLIPFAFADTSITDDTIDCSDTGYLFCDDMSDASVDLNKWKQPTPACSEADGVLGCVNNAGVGEANSLEWNSDYEILNATTVWCIEYDILYNDVSSNNNIYHGIGTSGFVSDDVILENDANSISFRPSENIVAGKINDKMYYSLQMCHTGSDNIWVRVFNDTDGIRASEELGTLNKTMALITDDDTGYWSLNRETSSNMSYMIAWVGGIDDAPYLSTATNIINSSWNVTSNNVIGDHETASIVWNDGEVVNVSSVDMSLTVTASINSNMSCSEENLNYTSMIDINSEFKSATTETTDHAFTLVDTFTLGENTIYCSFIASDGSGELSASTSGALVFDFQDIFNPSIIQDYQIPDDIIKFNALENLELSFNISDNVEIDEVYMMTSINSSDDIFYCINGSCTEGSIKNYYSHVSTVGSNYTFILGDNKVYGGTYALDERAMTSILHTTQSIGTKESYVKLELKNVTHKPINFFEIMANSTSAKSGKVYYCNSSYTTGDPNNIDDCTQFGSYEGTEPYNHSHSIYSQHWVIPFVIVDMKINNVGVSPTSYFLLRGETDWKYYDITNNTAMTELSTNKGGNWASVGQVDSHIHQFSSSDFFQYSVCANDTSGNLNCSSFQDSYIFNILPPNPPNVYNPTEGVYSGSIDINWTNSTIGISSILVYYDLDIYDCSGILAVSLGNQSLNLSDVYDTSGLGDDCYTIRITAFDNNSLSNFGESDEFIIDATNPIIDDDATNSTINTSDIKIYATLFDMYSLNGWRFGTNRSGIWNVTTYQNISSYNSYIANFTINTSGTIKGDSIGYYFEVIDMGGLTNRLNTSFLITDIPPPPPEAEGRDVFGVGQCPDTIPNVLILGLMLIVIIGLIIFSEITNMMILNFLASVMIFIQSWILSGCNSLYGLTLGLCGVAILSRGIYRLFSDQ